MTTEPRRADGTLDLARIAAQLALQMHPIGTALIACATHLALLNEITPARGEQRDLLNDLGKALAYIHDTYRDADERLAEAALVIDHERLVPNPLPLRDEAA